MNYKLIKHNTVHVQLFPLVKETITEEGIIMTGQEAYTTDGGKFSSKQSLGEYQSAGTIVAISPSAEKYTTETLLLDSPLKSGDEIYVDPSAAGSRNEFVIDRHKSVAGGHGIVEINVGNIQTTIKIA